MSGTRMNHVPYKGAAPAVADLLAGRIQVWVGAANSLLPHIKAEKLRVLGTAAPQRFDSLPDTPTIAEAGLPGYALYPWLGLFVPARTPPDIVAKINAEVSKILNTAEVKARLVPQGMDIMTGSPAELAKIIRDDHAHWGKVLREAGVRAE
jgi:tripartite-type tricarboxylate transporter receptor subunit TctC